MKQPRDKNGKFASTGSSSTKKTKLVKSNRSNNETSTFTTQKKGVGFKETTTRFSTK